MDFLNMLCALTPASPSAPIDWNAWEALFGAFFSGLRATQQNPAFHAEGDAFTHTQMVCRALNEMSEFHAMPQLPKAQLFTAAVLHDVGKIRTTRLEDGVWSSPRHSEEGSQMARSFLWQELGLCGTPEKLRFRETVSALIRCHMMPEHFEKQMDPQRKARGTAALGRLLPDFSWEVLCRLSEADILGRIAPDRQKLLDSLQLCRWLVQEADCFTAPYAFADPFTARAYLSGRNIPPELQLYDDTWGEVILMSGLPGTGKDTWIRENLVGLPMVSLDEIRKELRVSPDESGPAVIRQARERAKTYLRQKQPFVWNATDLSKEIRQNQVHLFEQYGARVRIVYLETDWAERVERNRSRSAAVPESAVEKMLSVTVPPVPCEAQAVDWLLV